MKRGLKIKLLNGLEGVIEVAPTLKSEVASAEEFVNIIKSRRGFIRNFTDREPDLKFAEKKEVLRTRKGTTITPKDLNLSTVLLDVLKARKIINHIPIKEEDVDQLFMLDLTTETITLYDTKKDELGTMHINTIFSNWKDLMYPDWESTPEVLAHPNTELLNRLESVLKSINKDSLPVTTSEFGELWKELYMTEEASKKSYTFGFKYTTPVEIEIGEYKTEIIDCYAITDNACSILVRKKEVIKSIINELANQNLKSYGSLDRLLGSIGTLYIKPTGWEVDLDITELRYTKCNTELDTEKIEETVKEAKINLEVLSRPMTVEEAIITRAGESLMAEDASSMDIGKYEYKETESKAKSIEDDDSIFTKDVLDDSLSKLKELKEVVEYHEKIALKEGTIEDAIEKGDTLSLDKLVDEYHSKGDLSEPIKYED